MKHIAMGAAIAAVALGLIFSNSNKAWADQSGDPDFCLGGWVQNTAIPTMTSEAVVVAEDAAGYYVGTKITTTNKYVCSSDF